MEREGWLLVCVAVARPNGMAPGAAAAASRLLWVYVLQHSCIGQACCIIVVRETVRRGGVQPCVQPKLGVLDE